MNIKISVYLNEVAQVSNKRLFERLIVWSDGILFPYDAFISVMRICFGDKSIITFEII